MSTTINTVLGPVGADELGVTYIHEHLYVKPSELPVWQDYTLDNIDNSVEEAKLFKAVGGSTIVDMTPLNYGRNTEVLRDIARRAGINIICVTGFHKQEFMPPWFFEMDDAAVATVIRGEIEDGIGWSQARPGAIKVGTSLGEITAAERRAIKLCGVLARDCGLPVITHCDKGTMGLEQLETLASVDVDMSRVCLSHVDLTKDVEYLRRLCDRGAYLSFDHVGRELDTHDAERVSMLGKLVSSGYGDRICLAGDMGKRDYFRSYGGAPGLDYILTKLRGSLLNVMEEEDFDRMLVDNPRRLLAGR